MITTTRILISDHSAVDAHGNLITVTASAFEGQARITGQLNGRTIREETLFSVNDQERLDASAVAMIDLLKRSAVPVAG